jgi:hypothetical protein
MSLIRLAEKQRVRKAIIGWDAAMKKHPLLYRYSLPCLLSCVLTEIGWAGPQAPPPVPPTAPVASADETDGAEPILRGPVHEAFAEPMRLNAMPNATVPKAPPEPVPEVPPEIRPADEGATWIPGYWAWDEDRKDFIWVSGIWRVVPPDRRWVPGYWSHEAEGYRWIAGFWTDTKVETVEYLPEPPPASLEIGPASPSPGDDYYWSCGYWDFYGGRYCWRPGFWAMSHRDWMWQPAHYNWTPRGFIFVAGYWDYPLACRGQIFAPVCFRRIGYYGPRGFYSPCIALDTPRLMFNLFVRPSMCHYYWGDYYGPSYLGRGWYPWVQYCDRVGYDPIFAFYRTEYRHRGMDFDHDMRNWYDRVNRSPEFRPPHTMRDQERFAREFSRDADMKRFVVASRLSEIAERPDFADRFHRIPDSQREQIRTKSNEWQKLVRQRHDVEAKLSDSAPGRAMRDSGPAIAGKGSASRTLHLNETPDVAVSKTVKRPPTHDAKTVKSIDRSPPDLKLGTDSARSDGRSKRDSTADPKIVRSTERSEGETKSNTKSLRKEAGNPANSAIDTGGTNTRRGDRITEKPFAGNTSQSQSAENRSGRTVENNSEPASRSNQGRSGRTSKSLDNSLPRTQSADPAAGAAGDLQRTTSQPRSSRSSSAFPADSGPTGVTTGGSASKGIRKSTGPDLSGRDSSRNLTPAPSGSTSGESRSSATDNVLRRATSADRAVVNPATRSDGTTFRIDRGDSALRQRSSISDQSGISTRRSTDALPRTTFRASDPTIGRSSDGGGSSARVRSGGDLGARDTVSRDSGSSRSFRSAPLRDSGSSSGSQSFGSSSRGGDRGGRGRN